MGCRSGLGCSLNGGALLGRELLQEIPRGERAYPKALNLNVPSPPGNTEASFRDPSLKRV